MTLTIIKTFLQASLGSDLGHHWNFPYSSTQERSRPSPKPLQQVGLRATLAIAKTSPQAPLENDLS